MRPFAFAKAATTRDAVAAVSSDRAARFIAGGTNIVDLMIDVVETPSLVVDINALPYAAIEKRAGFLRLGALARMSDAADNGDLREAAPFVAQALDASASAQLRNAASLGGNILQRTRCAYFRDPSQECNKREPGSGCAALHGENRMHAVIGGSDACIALHPSDFAVALVASDAIVQTVGRHGPRSIALREFYVEPLHDPQIETVLQHGELITAIDIPTAPILANSHYLKVRDRQSYEFALVSVAIALSAEGGIVRDVRLALGGVGTIPWRSHDAEATLIGGPATADAFERATDVALAGAVGRGFNDFKIPLVKRAVASAFSKVSA